MPADRSGRTWWRDGVLYQIYPRSYMDTNADGVGDLRGIIERLDHLQWLGVDGIWLDPIMVSPNDDWGYDVADYVDVDPALGTLADADTLIEEASKRGIRVLLDLVPNHTSDRHPWFVDAKSSRDSRHRDWYVWADPKPDGSFPNNWTMAFDPRQPAWTFDEASGQYYLNQFLPSQPDLNWWNEDVRDAFDAILRFWFDRGVAGFRIDVAHSVIKDRELRDNPPATPDDHWYVQMMGQRSVYNACRPEVHDVLRRWRKVAESYDPPRVLIGETYVLEPEAFASFYGAGDELNLAFNFMLLHSDFSAPQLRDAVEHAEQLLPDARVAGVDGRQSRQPPLPHPLVQERSGAHPRRARDADGAARYAVPLLRRRDRHDRHRRAEGPDPRPGRRVPRCAHGSRRRAHADAVVGGAGRRFLRTGRRAVAPLRRLRRVQRRRPAARSRLDAVADARSHRAARRAPRAARRRVPNVARAERRRVGVVARRTHRRRVQPLGRAGRHRRRRVRARSASPRSAPATTSASTAALHLAPWEAAIVWRDA